uniref:Uncharacterized protein n=1 Tax=Arundo donax TaxID=35708 RepID=A0A0A9SI61_ARUDO
MSAPARRSRRSSAGCHRRGGRISGWS